MGLLLLVIYIIVNKKIKNKYLYPLEITLLIGYFGYMLMMLLLYVYSFGPYEGPSLASFDRYMCSYLLICIYILIFIYIDYKDIDINKYKKYIFGIFIITILIRPISLLKLRPDLIILDNHKYDPYISASKVIDKNVDDMELVYIIDQEEKDGAYFYITYFSNKIKTNNLNYELDTISSNTKELFYNSYYYYMKDFNYLYTYSINDEFINKYSFLSDTRLEKNTLYKINKENNMIKLIKIESVK